MTVVKNKIEQYRKLREISLKILFQYDFCEKEEWEDQIRLFIETEEGSVSEKENLLREEDGILEEDDISVESGLSEEEKEALIQRALDIYEKVDELDEKISSQMENWSIRRVGKVDLSLLRLALYEILYDEKVPTKVAISEAVELAKIYGSDDSYRFVNGVLAKLVKSENE